MKTVDNVLCGLFNHRDKVTGRDITVEILSMLNNWYIGAMRQQLDWIRCEDNNATAINTMNPSPTALKKNEVLPD